MKKVLFLLSLILLGGSLIACTDAEESSAEQKVNTDNDEEIELNEKNEELNENQEINEEVHIVPEEEANNDVDSLDESEEEDSSVYVAPDNIFTLEFPEEYADMYAVTVHKLEESDFPYSFQTISFEAFHEGEHHAEGANLFSIHILDEKFTDLDWLQRELDTMGDQHLGVSQGVTFILSTANEPDRWFMEADIQERMDKFMPLGNDAPEIVANGLTFYEGFEDPTYENIASENPEEENVIAEDSSDLLLDDSKDNVEVVYADLTGNGSDERVVYDIYYPTDDHEEESRIDVYGNSDQLLTSTTVDELGLVINKIHEIDIVKHPEYGDILELSKGHKTLLIGFVAFIDGELQLFDQYDGLMGFEYLDRNDDGTIDGIEVEKVISFPEYETEIEIIEW